MRLEEFLEGFPPFHEQGKLIFIYPQGISVEAQGGRGILSMSLYNALVTAMQALVGETKIDLFQCKTTNKWVLHWNPFNEEPRPAACFFDWLLDFDPHEEVIFLMLDYNPTQRQWDYRGAFASKEEAKAALG